MAVAYIACDHVYIEGGGNSKTSCAASSTGECDCLILSPTFPLVC